MKQFRFKLAALLEIRKRKESSIKNEIGSKNREIFIAEKELFEFKEELHDFQQEQLDMRRTGADILTLKYSVSYRNMLKIDMLKKGKEIDNFYRELNTIRDRFVKSTQEKRALEIIRDKRYHEWEKNVLKKEQVFIDDISTQAYIRKKQWREKVI